MRWFLVGCGEGAGRGQEREWRLVDVCSAVLMRARAALLELVFAFGRGLSMCCDETVFWFDVST
jgi:hypothetical protein